MNWIWVLAILGYCVAGWLLQRTLGLVKETDEKGNVYYRASVHRWYPERRIIVGLIWPLVLLIKLIGLVVSVVRSINPKVGNFFERILIGKTRRHTQP